MNEKYNNMIKTLNKVNISTYIGIIIYLVISGIGIYFINNNLYMNDAFWHIKTGEWITKYGYINKCYGSWILKEDKWIAHEWLFGLMLYYVTQWGMSNIIRMFVLLYFLTVLLCFWQAGILKKNEQPPIIYWEIVLIFQFSVYALGMTARPQYITAIFIILYLIILEKSIGGNIKLLYLLPVITILWSNIHGGTTLLSYIIILAYLLCNILNWSIGKVKFFYAGKKWVVHCIIVLFLVIAAILINPYGYKMLIYPYENMQDTLMLSMIAEWAPPDAKDITTLFFQIIPMLLGVIALIQYQGSIRAHHITIFFLFIILYLRSIRFYPFLVVVQTCLITPYAFQLNIPVRIKKTKNGRVWNNLSIIVLGCICITYIIYMLYSADFQSIKKNKELPDELINEIRQDNPKRLFNHYNIGGYLLFNGIDVFIDGRYEPYNQKNIINDYVKMMYPSNIEEYNQLENIISTYDFDGFLVTPENVILLTYLDSSKYYKLKYKDEEWLYYKFCNIECNK